MCTAGVWAWLRNPPPSLKHDAFEVTVPLLAVALLGLQVCHQRRVVLAQRLHLAALLVELGAGALRLLLELDDGDLQRGGALEPVINALLLLAALALVHRDEVVPPLGLVR